MNNKKLIINITVGIVVIGLLVAALIVVMRLPDKKEETNDNTVKTEEKTIEILNIKDTDVASVTVTNELGEYSIINEGNDKYSLLNAGNIPYESSMLSLNFKSFLKLDATKDVTSDSTTFSQVAKVVLTLKDSTQKILILGNEVIGADSNFLKYEDKTYVVPRYSISAFTQDKDSFRKTQLGKIQPTMKSMSILENNAEFLTFRRSTEEESKSNSGMSSFMITYPRFMPASDDKLNPIFEFLKEGYELNVAQFVDNDIANAEKYGIGKRTFVIQDDANTYTIKFGNKDEKGNVYAIFGDQQYIITMTPELFDLFSQFTPDYLMEKFAHLINIEKVKSVIFEGDNKKYTLEIEGTGDKAKYKINSKSIKEEDFKKIYQEIIGITVDNIVDEADVTKKPEYTITFNYTDGKTDQFNYVSYNERNYVVQAGGFNKVLLKKKLPLAMENIGKIFK